MKNLEKSVCLFAIGAAAFLGACASGAGESAAAFKALQSGDYALAESLYLRGPGGVLELLNAASASRASLDFKKSDRLLLEALELADETDAAAPQNSDFILKGGLPPYRPSSFERIMANAFVALDEILARRYAEADERLIKAEDLAARAPQIEGERVSSAMKSLNSALASGGLNFDAASAVGEEAFAKPAALFYGRNPFEFDSSSGSVSEYLKNSYKTALLPWLRGLGKLASSKTRSEVAEARELFARALSIAPNNVFLKDDIAACENFLREGKLQRATYVFYESGFAPSLAAETLQIRVNPTGDDPFYSEFQTPIFAPSSDFSAALQIFSFGLFYSTEPLLLADEIAEAEFAASVPVRAGECVLRCAVNAQKNSAGFGDSENFDPEAAAKRVVKSEAGLAANRADLRIWKTLPKIVSYARIPTPERNFIIVENQRVELTPMPINFVYARRTSAFAPLSVKVFGLGEN
ncbi:MAG: hypothetical protein J6P03_08285 [Opitutales bacterium]|nr:hypothetical protein [Opitutales bacterium]